MRRRLRVLGVMAVLALALGTYPAGAATHPRQHITVRPSIALRNGEVVRVQGAGFKPHDSVYLVECLAVAQGQSQCDIMTATPAKITARGVLPVTRFKVHTGKIGKGWCGTTPRNLAACAISVGTATGQDTASARIRFRLVRK